MISFNDLESVVKAMVDDNYTQHSFYSIGEDITSQFQQSGYQVAQLHQPSHFNQSDNYILPNDNQCHNEQTLSTTNESPTNIFTSRKSSNSSSIQYQKANSLPESSLPNAQTVLDDQSYQNTVQQIELQNLTSTTDTMKYSKRITNQNLTDDLTDESDSTSNISSTPIPGKFRKPRTCKCPNCSVDGGNKTRDSNDKPQHICHISDCAKIFTNTGHLKRHLEWHSNEKKFVCAHCNKGFHRFDNLKVHIGRHMTVFKQRECKKSNSSADASNGIRDHNGDLLHICDVPDCRKVFSNSKFLKRHSVWHRRIFVCAYCDTRFTRKDNFTSHINTHMQNADKPNQSSGKVQHICSTPNCDRIFTDLEDLKKYLEYQSIEKNLEIQAQVQDKRIIKCQCPNCSVEGGNDTRDSKGRLLHVCYIPNCGKTYTRSLHLEEHLKRHASEKPYLCTCGHSFERQSKANSHLKVHELSNPNKYQHQINEAEGVNKSKVPSGRFIIMSCDMLPATIKIQNKLQLNVFVPPNSSKNANDTLNNNANMTKTFINDSISIPAIVTPSTYQIPLAIQEILSQIQAGRFPMKLPFWLSLSTLEENKFNTPPDCSSDAS